MAMSPVMGDERKEPEGADDGKVWWRAGREDAKAGRGPAERLLGGGPRERMLGSCKQMEV